METQVGYLMGIAMGAVTKMEMASFLAFLPPMRASVVLARVNKHCIFDNT